VKREQISTVGMHIYLPHCVTSGSSIDVRQYAAVCEGNCSI
jgi:hypothetical protein